MNCALASRSLTWYHVSITQIDKQHHFKQDYKKLSIKEDFILTILTKALKTRTLLYFQLLIQLKIIVSELPIGNRYIPSEPKRFI